MCDRSSSQASHIFRFVFLEGEYQEYFYTVFKNTLPPTRWQIFYAYRLPLGVHHYQRTCPEDLKLVKSWFYKEYKMLVSMRDCKSWDGGSRKTQNRWFLEPAAGAEKLEVFEILYRTPPRGGGVSPDLKYLSKITGFLRYLSPMTATPTKNFFNQD